MNSRLLAIAVATVLATSATAATADDYRHSRGGHGGGHASRTHGDGHGERHDRPAHGQRHHSDTRHRGGAYSSYGYNGYPSYGGYPPYGGSGYYGGAAYPPYGYSNYGSYGGGWAVGQVLPHQHRRYIVRNYRDYGWGPPPRGYAYYRTPTGDVLLAAIATGVILSIVGGY